jgi:hypothetical protein
VAGNGAALLALAAHDVVFSPKSRMGFVPDAGDVRTEVPDGDEKEAEAARRSARLARARLN